MYIASLFCYLYCFDFAVVCVLRQLLRLQSLHGRQLIGSALQDFEAAPPAPRFCDLCNCPKPPLTHHCHICAKCVLRMDHHCPVGASALSSAHSRKVPNS